MHLHHSFSFDLHAWCTCFHSQLIKNRRLAATSGKRCHRCPRSEACYCGNRWLGIACLKLKLNKHWLHFPENVPVLTGPFFVLYRLKALISDGLNMSAPSTYTYATDVRLSRSPSLIRPVRPEAEPNMYEIGPVSNKNNAFSVWKSTHWLLTFLSYFMDNLRCRCVGLFDKNKSIQWFRRSP